MTKLFSIDTIALPLLIIPIVLVLMLLLTVQLYYRTKRLPDLYIAIALGLGLIASIQPFRWANGTELVFWSSPFQWATVGVLLATTGSLYFSKVISVPILATFLISILANLISVTLSPTMGGMVAAAGFIGIGVQLLLAQRKGQVEVGAYPYLFLVSGLFVLIGHWIPYNGGRFLFGMSLVVVLAYDLSRFFSRVVALLQTASFNSLTDGLTGLYNKSFLFRKADQLAKAGEIGIIFADIDNFKQLNDTKGHEEGDVVLKQTGALLKEVIGKNGYACRFGGEELVGIVHSGDAVELAERFCRLVSKKTIVTVSVGVALGKEDGSKIIRVADERMYSAKSSGKNKVVSK